MIILRHLPYTDTFAVECHSEQNGYALWGDWQTLASTTTHEAALAALRLLGATEYEDWTK